MIPYYSPNLHFIDVIKALFVWKPEKKIIKYFQKYTGKRHILITNSCRTALFLSYVSIEKGEVITSPLTCSAAIKPITESGCIVKYVDINVDNLNIELNHVSRAINTKTVAIQLIHLGGVSCNVKKALSIAKENNVYLIEDCAQGFGASYDGLKSGELGDISCFSMIKNLFGIGGGILATNDTAVYTKAQDILMNHPRNSIFLTMYRIIRNLVETKRQYYIFESIYQLLMNNRGKRNKKSHKKSIRRLNWLDLRINMVQMMKAKKINNKRTILGNKIIKALQVQNLMSNYKDIHYHESTFTKFYVYSDKIKNSKEVIAKLNRNNIEAMHLEQKFKCRYQEKMINDINLKNYNNVHDNLISIPLYNIIEFEKYTKIIIDTLKRD